MKRRDFIQRGTMALAGAAAFSSNTFALPAKGKIGIQLYTVRDVVFKDAKGVLKQLTDYGYQEWETFGYNDGKLFGMPVKEFAEYARSLGVTVPSGHYAYGKTERTKAMKGTILNDWERAVADAKEVGQENMVLAYLADDERKTIDDYKVVCEKLNAAGELCKKYGLRMSYHNHAFEFDKIDNQVPYHLMLSSLDPKLVGMEMDLYWTIFAGEQPLDYFKKYPGRFEQWHVKDMDKADRKKNANIGTGSIDFKAIFAQAKLAGMKHFYAEFDTFPGASMDSAKASVDYLKAL